MSAQYEEGEGPRSVMRYDLDSVFPTPERCFAAHVTYHDGGGDGDAQGAWIGYSMWGLSL